MSASNADRRRRSSFLDDAPGRSQTRRSLPLRSFFSVLPSARDFDYERQKVRGTMVMMIPRSLTGASRKKLTFRDRQKGVPIGMSRDEGKFTWWITYSGGVCSV